MRSVHALRLRDRRRPAHRLRRKRFVDGGHHLPRRAVHLLLLRQHRPDLPGRSVDREALPLQGPPVGPLLRGDELHHVLRRLSRRARLVVEPAAPIARRRLRTHQPRVALRQGSLLLRARPLVASRAQPDGPQRRRDGGVLVARGARRRGGRSGGRDRPARPRFGGDARWRAGHQRRRLPLDEAHEERARHRPRRRSTRRRAPGRGRARSPRRDHRRPRARLRHRAARTRSEGRAAGALAPGEAGGRRSRGPARRHLGA